MNTNTLGRKMFKGATVGAGLGAIGGGVYGNMKASDLISNPPVDKVEIGGYERPLFVQKTVGGKFHLGFDGVNIDKVKANFPVRYPDGSLKTEYVQPQTVTGQGKGTITYVEHKIEEPVINKEYLRHDRTGINSDTYVHYEQTGETWVEPVVKFDTAVNRLGYIAGYAALGAVAGGIGGAIVAAAVSN